MLLNYFKIALRQLLRNKLFTAITIFGLTIGFLSFGVLGLYVHDELSFDSFHKDADRMYRIVEHRREQNGTMMHMSAVSAQLGNGLREQHAGVEDVVRIFFGGRVTIGNDPMLRAYERTTSADSNFFRFFDYKLLSGNPETALVKPNTLVLTEKTAAKYFGTEPPLGKTIWVDGTMMEVTGVMQNPPHNSHLDIPLIFSVSTWTSSYEEYRKFISDWTSNEFATYIKLNPEATPEKIEGAITALAKSKADKEFRSNFGLQPITAIHTGSAEFQANEMYARAGINPFYIYMFISVAFLILLIACLNYMNLSTAAAIRRTREIGTRKSLGALRSQLVMQFTSEAVLFSVIAMVFALALLQFALPFVNEYTSKQMKMWTLEPQWIAAGIITMIGAGLLSSLYPTYVVSRVAPTAAMKKEVKLGTHTLPVRKMLIVAQFTISIIMIASTLIIYRQIQFMRHAELGVNVDNLVVIDINSPIQRGKFEVYKEDFGKLPEVSSVTVSSRVPGEWKEFPVASLKSGDLSLESIFVGADNDFLKTYQIDLIEGRNFRDLADTTKVMISKLCAEQLGLTDPIGAIIEIPSVRFGGQVENLETLVRVEVIGIIDNFHFQSMRTAMMPLIIGYWKNPIHRIDYYTLRVNTSDWENTLDKFRAINAQYDTDNPVEHTFLNQRFAEFYQADLQRGQVFLGFSILIIVIASLGLFALVSYSVESRTREIGIRKVLGASVQTIVSMVSKEFLLLVLVAAVIAVPVTWLFMAQWLQDFAYRIPLGAGAFILAGAITLLIAGITIGVRAYTAAVGNPVDSLRRE